MDLVTFMDPNPNVRTHTAETPFSSSQSCSQSQFQMGGAAWGGRDQFWRSRPMSVARPMGIRTQKPLPKSPACGQSSALSVAILAQATQGQKQPECLELSAMAELPGYTICGDPVVSCTARGRIAMGWLYRGKDVKETQTGQTELKHDAKSNGKYGTETQTEQNKLKHDDDSNGKDDKETQTGQNALNHADKSNGKYDKSEWSFVNG